MTTTGSPNAPLPTEVQFTGQRFDGHATLYHFGARMYDPLLGRFLQADTLVPGPGNPQAFSRYAYVLDNPLRFTDPTGHRVDPCDIGLPGCNLPNEPLGGWTPDAVARAIKGEGAPGGKVSALEGYSDDCFFSSPVGGGLLVNAACLHLLLEAGVDLYYWNPATGALAASTVRLAATGGDQPPSAPDRGDEGLAAALAEGTAGVPVSPKELYKLARGGIYVLKDPLNPERVMYVGMTKDFRLRERQHRRDPIKGQYQFERLWPTDVKAERRGLEQIAYEVFNPPLNENRPLSPAHPLHNRYLDAARDYLRQVGTQQ